MNYLTTNLMLLLVVFCLGKNQIAKADIVSDAELLFNNAEDQFSQFFSPKLTTQSNVYPEWPYYRGPYNNNIFAGINSNGSVYILGGAFGDSPAKIGTLPEVLTMLNNPQHSPVSGGVNSGLGGHMILARHKLNLSTGNYSSISTIDAWFKFHEEADDIRNLKDAKIKYSYDGKTAIVTTLNCVLEQWQLDIVCVAIIDVESGRADELKINQDGDMSIDALNASLSLDGQYFAVASSYASSTSDLTLSIYDRSGSEVAYGFYPGPEKLDEIGLPEWLSDGSLIFSAANTIYRTEPYKAKGIPIKSFTEKPSQPSISPDQTKIAFKLGQFIWVMDIDGNNLSQLVEAAPTYKPDEVPEIRFPVWSPDGKWIAVLVGGSDKFSNNTQRFYTNLLAIPSGSEKAQVGFEGQVPSNANNLSEGVINIQGYARASFDGLINETNLHNFFGGFVSWVEP